MEGPCSGFVCPIEVVNGIHHKSLTAKLLGLWPLVHPKTLFRWVALAVKTPYNPTPGQSHRYATLPASTELLSELQPVHNPRYEQCQMCQQA